MSASADKSAIFISGNSRSGTTMMSRILGNHDDIYTFQEIHFFDEIVNTSSFNQSITIEKAATVYAKLISINRKGYFGSRNITEYINESTELIGHSDQYTLIETYKTFLFNESKKNNKFIPCEHTPQNIFYLNELFNTFTDAKVIVMIRDPRAVLLSQKNKWKRRNLSGGEIPFWESVRSRVNYHPLTISKIWKAVMTEADKYKNNNSVLFVKYEDLISDTEATLKKVCSFIKIDFNKKMLDIPVVGSSNFIDSGTMKGVDSSKTEQWKNGGLNSTEIHICQNINSSVMNQYHYKAEHIKPSIFLQLFYNLMLPFQLFLSVLFNLKRLKKPVTLFKKIFGK